MKDDNKLIDAIIDLGVGMKELRDEMKGIREEMKGMRTEQQETNHRLDSLEKEQHKTNILLAEHSHSIIELAKQQEKNNKELKGLRSDFNKYAGANDSKIIRHEKRIIRLEDVSLTKEPKTKYKKTK